MLLNTIIGLLIFLLVVVIGLAGVLRPEILQGLLIRSYFGNEKPESNFFYRQMTHPIRITETKIMGSIFVMVGLFLLGATLFGG